ncbi:MAG: ComEC/Rec2 family competence protein [Candidatus Kerfeldbacteria bacterium]|nr:ComEC/Rec2 family competence protein [Candidatus Kerfeldbacteria bacterium]
MEGKLHPAQIWRYLTIGLVAGFIVGTVVNLSWYFSLVGCLVAGFLVWQASSLRVFSWLALGFLAAMFSASLALVPPPASMFVGRQQFEAQIVEPPRLSERARRYVVEPSGWSAAYRILLTTKLYPKFNYGDILQVDCKQVETITFGGYVTKGIWRQCSFPELKFLSQAQPNLRQKLLQWRDLAGDRLRLLLPEPEASLASSMLWGDDAGLPGELTAAFRRTGTSHLLAVSGYNVMILSEVLFSVLLALGLFRRQASLVVLVLVGLFVLFTGAEPPVVRAGIMGSLVIIGRLLWRKPDNLNLLLGSASAMLLVAPRLIYDFGFQLSFAAMAGLLWLAQPLAGRLKFLPAAVGLREAASQTLAANITTLPLILWRVDQLSLVGPVANLLIAPVVVVIFTFGLLVVLVSSIMGWSALPLAWPLAAALWYVRQIVESLSQLPGAVTHASWLAWLAVAVVYGGLAWWLKPKRLKL